MSIKTAILRKIGLAVPVDRNELGEMEVLIHKDARHHAAHGFVVASCRALNIKSGVVAVVLPDFDDAPPVTVRLLIDLQEAFHAQGWTLSHIVAWDGVANVKNSNASIEHHIEPEGFSTPGWQQPQAAEVAPDATHIPAYLRKTQGNLEQASGVLTFPRRDALAVKHGTGVQEDGIVDPTVLRLITTANKRVEHLDDMTRNASKIRFEQIGANGLTTGKSYEFISDKLSAAVEVILQAHRDAETESTAAQS